jgi:hypothetical protein
MISTRVETACRKACDRGVQWCLDLQEVDGSIRMPTCCLDSFHKFPAAFAVMGLREDGYKGREEGEALPR